MTKAKWKAINLVQAFEYHGVHAEIEELRSGSGRVYQVSYRTSFGRAVLAPFRSIGTAWEEFKLSVERGEVSLKRCPSNVNSGET